MNTSRPGIGTPLKFVIFIIVLLVAIGAFMVIRNWQASDSAPTEAGEVITQSELADRYGIQITLIGVTAGGGMIDFRFKVLDSQKAQPIFSDPEKLPILSIAGNDNKLQTPGGAFVDTVLEDNTIYFILYGNSGGLIQQGTPVLVSFGDVQLEPIPAQ